jgi:DNA-binding CsgD family transcriptional regulator
LREAAALAAAHGAHVRLARVLEAMSGAVVEVQPAVSVRLAVAAQSLRASLQALPLPSERERLRRYLEEARRQLGERVYGETWSAAHGVPTETVVAEGRALLDQILAPAAPGVRPTMAEPLSEREREVVLLLLRGLNNREIAEELTITRKTAEAHVSRILTKLTLSSRLQIVNWAHDRGLAQPNRDGLPGT